MRKSSYLQQLAECVKAAVFTAAAILVQSATFAKPTATGTSRGSTTAASASASVRLPRFDPLPLKPQSDDVLTVKTAPALIHLADQPSTTADIRSDGLLGTAISSSSSGVYTITGGQIRGQNIFEGFSSFNVGTGDTANFALTAMNGATPITNILVRVTGQQSVIDGTVETTVDSSTIPHPASLYLINPAGIVFNANSAFNIGGGLTITTADSVNLGSKGRFDAVNPSSSVLTGDSPTALAFAGTLPAPITVNGQTSEDSNGYPIYQPSLNPAAGDSLVVVGGKTSINAGELAATGTGAATVVSVGSVGAVNLKTPSDTDSFSSLAQVNVINGGFLGSDALAFSGEVGTGNASGPVTVKADQVVIDGSDNGGPSYATDSELASRSGSGTAGSLQVSASRAVIVINGGFLGSDAAYGTDSSSVIVNAAVVSVDGAGPFYDSELSSAAGSSGTAGPLRITASGAVSATNGGFIGSDAIDGADAGEVAIKAASIGVGTDAFLASYAGSGDSGALKLDARAAVSITNGGFAGCQATQRSGDVNITASSVNVTGADSDGNLSTLNSISKDGTAGTVEMTTAAPVASDLASDNTLGIGNDTVISAPTSGGVYTITGGKTIGADLFHSFSSFTVGTGDTASFRSGAAIGNIVVRVTGAHPSTIDGTVQSILPDGSLSPAAFYLLNPAGVIFTKNSQLDLGGSFVVSTADYVRLPDDVEFDSDGATPPAVRGGTPAAFGFLSPHDPAGVTIDSNLSVPDGHSFVIIAGDIQADSGTAAASGGAIAFAAVGSAGQSQVARQVIYNPTSSKAPLSLVNGSFQGNVGLDLTIANGDQAGTTRGGHIVVGAGNVFLTDGSSLDSQSYGTLATGSANGLGMSLQLSGELFVDQTSNVLGDNFGAGTGSAVTIAANEVFTAGNILSDVVSTGNGGDLTVAAKTIVLTNAGGVFSSGYSTGRPSKISVTSSGDLMILDGARIGTNSYPMAIPPHAASVDVSAQSLELYSGGQIDTTTYGDGQAGGISIRSRSIDIERYDSNVFTGISSESTPEAGQTGGPGGFILIQDANRVILGPGAVVSAATAAAGAAGNITIDAQSVVLNESSTGDETAILASAGQAGPPGKIEINAVTLVVENEASIDATTTDSPASAGIVSIHVAATLALDNHASIAADTDGTGLGGAVEIVCDKLSISSGSSISSQSAKQAGGNAGALFVHAKDIGLATGGIITSATQGTGMGGDVHIHAGQIDLDGSGAPVGDPTSITAQSTSKAGNAGNVKMESDQLRIDGGAAITASSKLTGAGDITISTGDFSLQNGTVLTAAAGAGGNISIDASSKLVVSPQSQVSASSGGTGNGGNIAVSGGALVFLPVVERDEIVARANQGNGGSISIESDDFVVPLLTPADVIDASSNHGLGGTIRIASPENDLAGELTPLVSSLAAPAATLVPACGMQVGSNQSSFTLEGGNGLPPDPANVQSGQPVPNSVKPTTQPAEH